MPTTEQRPLKVFLCHASQDKPAVRELSQRLFAEGWIDPWVDEKKLLPGQDWRTKIEEAVETSDVVIICLSTNSVSKEGFVQKELRYAREIAFEKPEETIFLIPLRLDDCNVPRGLRFYQWGDYFGEKIEETYAALLESLKLRYEQKLKIEEEFARREKERKEREYAEKAEREKAEREAAEKLAEEKAAREKAEKEAAEKARVEAEERARIEKEEKERTATEIAAQEKEKREVAEKTKREKAEQEAAEKAIRQKAKRELAEKAKREKAEHRAAQIIALKVTFSNAKPFLRIGGIIGIISLVLWVGSWVLPKLISLLPTAKATEVLQYTPTVTFTVSPIVATRTAAPSLTPTKVFTPTVTPLPTEITDSKDVAMVLVPAGEFTMGSNSDGSDEKPAHQINLESFYIDKYEVTNNLYAICIEAGYCAKYQDGYQYSDSQYSNYPVEDVSWEQAKNYCEWRGMKLPTEAQWEKAARGVDGRTFPWGNEFDGNRLNYCDQNCNNIYYNTRDANINDGYSEIAPVGSYPSGASPYGALDMAGNVMEWVSSLHKPYPYNANDGREDLNAEGGRVLRGGSYWQPKDGVRVSYRSWNATNALNLAGFRCASASSDVMNSKPMPIETSTPTSTISSISTSLPKEIIDAKGVSMVLVPAGNFIAGEKGSETNALLNAFYIDKYEVTNSEYSECVSSGKCQPPADTVLATYNYYGNPQYDNFPVVWVNITMAGDYCKWRGGRLPSELEWEKAARGTYGRIYPWGDTIDSNTRANSYGNKDGYEITSPVGSFPDGISPYGAYDMVGNVWEWTSEISYSGGSWVWGDLFVYNHFSPVGGGARFDVGFRCAKDANP